MKITVKKGMLSFALAIVMTIGLLSVPIASYAAVDQIFTSGSFQYKVLTESGNAGTVEVYDVTGTVTTLTIPSTISYGGRTYTVTRVGKNAFSNCTSMMSVAIPNSVTSLDDYAFFIVPS